MDTRDFNQIKKELLDKFETACQKNIEKIDKLRIEKLKKLDEELTSLKPILVTIGVVFLIINFLFSFFPGIIVLIVLAIIYFAKKIKTTNDIQNALREKLENLTLDYISLQFTSIEKRRIESYRSRAEGIVKKIKPTKASENIILLNVFSGKHKGVDFEIIEAGIHDEIEKNSDKIITFEGSVYKIHLNSEFKNNTVPQKLTQKINDILGKLAISSTFDYDGNLIFALKYRVLSGVEVKAYQTIQAPRTYLEEVLIHLSYVYRIVDTIEKYKEEATVPNEVKMQIAQKIKEIKFSQIENKPKTESIIAEVKPIKKENPQISQIENIIPQEKPKEIIKKEVIEKPKAKEPKIVETKTEEVELEVISEDTIDLMDIVEF